MAITETEKKNLADAIAKVSKYPSNEAAGHIDRLVEYLDIVFQKNIVVLTQAEYDALDPVDSNVIYFIVG